MITGLKLTAASFLLCFFVSQSAGAAVPEGATPLTQQQVNITQPANSEGIAIIAPTDEAFSPLLDHMLAPNVRQEITPILPDCLIVRNDSGQYIWGFTVIYGYPDQVTPNGKIWRRQINVSPGGAVGRDRMLAPGAYYLVTPVPGIAASASSTGVAILQPSYNLNVPALVASATTQSTQLGSRLNIAVDSVVFESGLIAGPDEGGQRIRLQAMMQAEKDVVNATTNQSGNGLKSSLETLYAQPITGDYSLHVHILAGHLLSVLNDKGEASAKVVINSISASRRFTGDLISTQEGK